MGKAKFTWNSARLCEPGGKRFRAEPTTGDKRSHFATIRGNTAYGFSHKDYGNLVLTAFIQIDHASDEESTPPPGKL
jgi:hypothetical protein